MATTPISAPNNFRFFDTFIAAVTLTVAILPLVAFPTAMSYVHELFDLVVSSRSTVKIFFVAIFTIALFFVRDLTKKHIRSYPHARKIFLVAVGVLFVFNAISFLRFAGHYDIPVNARSIVFNNGEISSTSLAHNHVLKGVLAPLLSWHDNGYFENVDVGTAFTGLENPLFYGFCFLSFIVALIASFFVYLDLLPEYRSPNSQRVLTIVFSVAAVGILVRLLDGGIFSDSILVYVFVFAFLLFRHRAHAIREMILTAALYVLALLCLTLGGFMTGWGEFGHRLALSAVGVMIFLPFVLYLYYERVTRLIVLIAIATLLTIALTFVEDSGSFEYLTMPLHPGSVVAMYQTPKGAAYTPKASVGALTFYSIDMRAKNAPKTISDVLASQHLHDNFYPVAVPFETCIPSSPPTAFEFTLATPEPLSEFPHPDYISVVKFDHLRKIGNFERYQVRLMSPACWPRFLNVLDELIKAKIGEPTIIYGFDYE